MRLNVSHALTRVVLVLVEHVQTALDRLHPQRLLKPLLARQVLLQR
jgi:hypothetical protein